MSTIVQSNGCEPTPYSKSIFNEDFHANKHIALGLIPIVKFSNIFNLRTEGYCFLPIKKIILNNDNKIGYKDFFSKPSWLAESTIVCNLPFTTIGLFVNYCNNPKYGWNVGLNIGYLIRLPSF